MMQYNFDNTAHATQSSLHHIDDGYRSTHDFALPILKELNLPATVFITTDTWTKAICGMIELLKQCDITLWSI